MANYNAFVRSSYFAVNDIEAFKNWFNGLGADLEVWDGKNDDGVPLVAFGGYETVPDSRYNEEVGDWDEIDFFQELQDHITDGWAVIIQEAGYEKLRYLSTYVWTVTNEEIDFYNPMGEARDALKAADLYFTDATY